MSAEVEENSVVNELRKLEPSESEQVPQSTATAENKTKSSDESINAEKECIPENVESSPWGKQETLKLIELYKANKGRFVSTSIKNHKIWLEFVVHFPGRTVSQIQIDNIVCYK
jgi:hypothetical protein